MNSAIVWILFPLFMAGVIFGLSRWKMLSYGLAVGTATLECLAVWFLPVGEPFFIGQMRVEVVDSFSVLGRQFTISADEQSLILLIFLGAWVWICGSIIGFTQPAFPGIALAFAALLTAALAVQPFLYAALIIEIAALVAIYLLHEPGSPPTHSVMRFLIFQTLGFPFILFTGWLLESPQNGIQTGSVLLQAGLFIAFGFSFMIGIFPLHSWIPMLGEENHSYSVSYIFYLLPLVGIVFALRLFTLFPELGGSEAIINTVKWSGVFVMLVGGIWAAFETHLGRMLAFVSMADMGMILLSASGGGQQIDPVSVRLLFIAMIPRGIALAVWGLGIVVLANHVVEKEPGAVITARDLDFRTVQGAIRNAPFAATAILAAHFSMIGLPLLAGFPVKISLYSILFSNSLVAGVAMFLSSIGLLAGALRTFTVFFWGHTHAQLAARENKLERIFLGVGLVGMIYCGVFPESYASFFADIGRMFTLAISGG